MRSEDDIAAGLDAVQALARRCAVSGLSIRQARELLTQLAMADAVMLEQGNVSAAARRLGVQRRYFYGRGPSEGDA